MPTGEDTYGFLAWFEAMRYANELQVKKLVARNLLIKRVLIIIFIILSTVNLGI